MKRMNKLFQTRLPLFFAVCSILLASCTKNYDEINTDRNAIATVGPAELPFLFAKAEQTAIPNIWNYQIAQNLFADQYAQYFACTATYFPSDRLNIRMDWVGAAFNPIYTDLVPQLQSIFGAAETNSPEYALAQVVWVLGFHRVTDYWGPIPYFNAGVPGNSVPYDAQDVIYDDFFKKLDSAATVLQANPGAQPYGSFDLIYGGDINKWLKFTNSLRLRLALRISNVDPARAKAEAEAAVAGGVLENSPSEDAYLLKSQNGADHNGLSQMSDWNEFRMSATMESVMNGYEDPRREIYWLPAGATGDDPDGTDGSYHGLRNGLTAAQLTEGPNKATANSKVGKRWSSPSFGGDANYLTTPLNVMSVAESWFNRAEGALLNWDMNGTAKELYEKGIKASMNQWGITDEAAITAYTNSTKTPVAPEDYLNSPAVSDAPVKWAGDIETQREQISIQKWLAMFPDGNEAWADFRRARYFKMYPVANSENPDLPDPTTEWIRRIPFLLSEKQNNGAEVEKAVPLLGGEDKITTPLWWDTH